MMYPQKHYANCGIQTDSSVNQSPLCSPKILQFPVDHSCVITGSDVPSSESDITLANGSLVFECAYNQSPDSQNHDSLLPSSRHCAAGILYSRPSESRVSAKRVLSLNGVSPTKMFKTTMLGDKLRLVSMPERGKYAGFSAKESLLQKRCIDDLDDTGNHEPAERPYPADLPQTPSPPSSPESITIIGNKTHVSGLFLCRPGDIDSGGWVSWANSPPRPIPALHGPSSLPYARCPSGAEGTLVEGDDLSHKIWGLGIEDSQMVHPLVTSRSSVRQASQPQDHHPFRALPAAAMNLDEFALSHYYERDTVIDLSRPAALYGHVGTQRVLSKKNVENVAPALPMTTKRQTQIPQLAVETFTTLRANNLKFKESYKTKQSNTLAVGLGLHTWSSRGSRPENLNPIYEISSNPLNTAAPVFVPASAMKAHQKYAPQSTKPLTYCSAPRRPSVFNNFVEQYQQADTQSLLPTPPSTSSPCWTPIFSHQPEMAISKSSIPTVNPKVSTADSYSPNIYSPISNLEDDSSRIKTIMRPTIQDSDVACHSKVVPHVLSFQKGPFPFQAYPPKLDSLQVDDVSLYLKATSGSPHGNLPQVEPLQADVGTQGYAERRRNLSYQQPRSIPLVRLIQRRLSSVAEEDPSTKVLSPFLQEAQTGRFTRSKRLSLETLDPQMLRTGLLDEEIFTTEMFSVRAESDRQLLYEAESMLNSGQSKVVVKLPPKTSILCPVVPGGDEKFLRYDKATGQATNTRSTNTDISKRCKIRVKKRSTATITTDDT